MARALNSLTTRSLCTQKSVTTPVKQQFGVVLTKNLEKGAVTT